MWKPYGRSKGKASASKAKSAGAKKASLEQSKHRAAEEAARRMAQVEVKPGQPSTLAPPKRQLRYRKKCPVATMERAERVMSQRMYMVQREVISAHPDPYESFSVLGSTGNVYDVTIGAFPSCSCPDFRKGNSPCKHVIFVFLKILKVPLHSLHWFQRHILPDELQEIYRSAPVAVSPHVGVSERIHKFYMKATGREAEAGQEEVTEGGETDEKEESRRRPGTKLLTAIGDDCPVCYEAMTADENTGNLLIFDLAIGGCGRPIHIECFNTWRGSRLKSGYEVTCVSCNGKWAVERKDEGKAELSAGPSYSSGGYLNLAAEMGISRVRDTSSYFPGLGRNLYSYDDD